MTPKELHKQLKLKTPPTVLDVRSGMEYRMGHIPGALHLPLWKLLFRLGRIPKEKNVRLVVVCESGARAQMAASMLQKRGYANIELVVGDMAGWRQAGLPVDRS